MASFSIRYSTSTSTLPLTLLNCFPIKFYTYTNTNTNKPSFSWLFQQNRESTLHNGLHLPITAPFSKCTSLPSSVPVPDTSSPRIAVLLQVDGVLIDTYRSVNREAFNVAFQKLGLDCAKWTEPIYTDLWRKGAGDEERMLGLYFDRIGWPTSLPTSEKHTFMKSVLEEKKKALGEFLICKNTPLRPGVKKFIDDAYEDGMCVLILTTSSKFGEDSARSIVEKLGVDSLSKVKVIGKKEIEKSLYSRLVTGSGKLTGANEDLANEASKAVAAEKKRIANEVASLLKLRVDINTGTPESLREIVAALRAAAENAEAPICNCVLVAGSQPAIAAAEIIGMPCIVLRNSLTSRAEFPSAVSVMDGFGDVDLTTSKLRLTLSRLSQ